MVFTQVGDPGTETPGNRQRSALQFLAVDGIALALSCFKALAHDRPGLLLRQLDLSANHDSTITAMPFHRSPQSSHPRPARSTLDARSNYSAPPGASAVSTAVWLKLAPGLVYTIAISLSTETRA